MPKQHIHSVYRQLLYQWINFNVLRQEKYELRIYIHENQIIEKEIIIEFDQTNLPIECPRLITLHINEQRQEAKEFILQQELYNIPNEAPDNLR